MSMNNYVPLDLGTNALKRLGVRIGERAELSDVERDLYERFVRDARERMVFTRDTVNAMLPMLRQRIVRLGDVEIVGRVKTFNTLADKLERTPEEKLPSIRDVAGLRLVAELSVMEQQVVSQVLRRWFDEYVHTSRDAKLIDRIRQPQNGYRAQHLIVWPGGRPVEIQVRTEWQHAWAQLMEIVGDRWGREPRYGEPVRGATSVERAHRQQVVDSIRALSEAIADLERLAQSQGVLHMEIDEPALERLGVDLDAVAKLRQRARATTQQVEEAEAKLRTQIDLLRENIAI